MPCRAVQTNDLGTVHTYILVYCLQLLMLLLLVRCCFYHYTVTYNVTHTHTHRCPSSVCLSICRYFYTAALACFSLVLFVYFVAQCLSLYELHAFIQTLGLGEIATIWGSWGVLGAQAGFRQGQSPCRCISSKFLHFLSF